MKKISQRETVSISENINDMIDSNIDYVVNDVKQIFSTLKTLKITARNNAMDYVAKKTLGITKLEAEKEYEKDPDTLSKYTAKLSELEEEWVPKIKYEVEKIVVDRVYDTFMSNVNVTEQATDILKNRINNI